MPRCRVVSSVRILIFHGYLLEGTGSNVYNARLAAALLGLGHEVHLLCQDRHPERQPFVDASGRLGARGRCACAGARAPRRAGALHCLPARTSAGCCRCTWWIATRGSKRAPSRECGEEQIERYIEANVAAVREVAERVRPHVGARQPPRHGPRDPRARARRQRALRRQGARQRARVHRQGRSPSASSPYAREGAGAGRRESSSAHATPRAACGRRSKTPPSRRARASVLPGWTSRAFGLARPSRRPRAVRALGGASARWGSQRGGEPIGPGAGQCLHARRRVRRAGAGAPRPRARPIGGLRGQADRNKGVRPAAGGLAAGARARAGRAARRRRLRRRARAPGGGRRARCPSASLFTGRLDHEELAELLPACEALVVPSTFPEAFGMVAAEGAACGALPVSAAHSGLAEVSERIGPPVPCRGRAVAVLPRRRPSGAGARRVPHRLAAGRARSALTERARGWSPPCASTGPGRASRGA